MTENEKLELAKTTLSEIRTTIYAIAEPSDYILKRISAKIDVVLDRLASHSAPEALPPKGACL